MHRVSCHFVTTAYQLHAPIDNNLKESILCCFYYSMHKCSFISVWGFEKKKGGAAVYIFTVDLTLSRKLRPPAIKCHFMQVSSLNLNKFLRDLVIKCERNGFDSKIKSDLLNDVHAKVSTTHKPNVIYSLLTKFILPWSGLPSDYTWLEFTDYPLVQDSGPT